MKKKERKKGVIIATLAVLVLGLGVWLLWPKSDALAAARKELLKSASDDAFQRLGELPFDQRRGNLFRDLWERRTQKHAEEYYKLPPDKRRDYLDKQIAEMEKWRKEREARRNQDGPGGGQGQGPGPGGQGPGGGGGGGGNGGRGGWGGGRNASPEQRSQMANGRLDRSDPSQRAQMAGYMGDLLARRAQLGLPVSYGRTGR
jgi:uncharacterized membrane protein YgcG